MNAEQEFSALLAKTDEELRWDYFMRFLEFLTENGWSDEDGEIPMAVWAGIADAIANASGCRVILKAHLFEPDNEEANVLQIAEEREILSSEPMLFLRLWREAEKCS